MSDGIISLFSQVPRLQQPEGFFPYDGDQAKLNVRQSAVLPEAGCFPGKGQQPRGEGGCGPGGCRG